MARDLNVAERTTVPRVCPRRHARQAHLPLICAAPSDALPRLLRLPQVGEITDLRRSMIYQLEADGNFPRR
jgi:hypothetical protein